MTAVQHASDPRHRRDGLGWVTGAVFGDPRLRLHIQPAGQPALADAAARYAIVPSLERARFLLPLASRRVAVASTLAYNGLRPARVRASRLAVGALAALRCTSLAGMPVLSVHVPDGVDPAEVLLTAHLANRFGHPLHAAIGIRPPDPHHKPTLQLFDDQGEPQGYAKVGWNDATRALVRAEAAALRELPATGGDHPDIPGLLDSLHWGERVVTIVRPMPRGVRRLRRPDVPRIAAMLAVARRGGAPNPPQALHGSPFLEELARRAATTGGAVVGHVAALGRRDADTVLEFGDWHGDWVPWNLGRHGARLIAWDWENRGTNVPVGFDLAHQGFQTALNQHGRSAHAAMQHMLAVLAEYGPALGLDARRQRLVADAYLIEMWLRTADLAAGGGGWNARLHLPLLRILDVRLGDTASVASQNPDPRHRGGQAVPPVPARTNR